jgi:hypothetical protein
MTAGRPLRFLALTLGLWVVARAALLAPGWWGRPAEPERSVPAAGGFAAARSAAIASGPVLEAPSYRRRLPQIAAARPVSPPRAGPEPTLATAPAMAASVATASGGPGPAGLGPPAAMPEPRRWTASAWLLVRQDGGGAALAPGGTLGGSQAGARLLRRLGGGLALSGRLYVPLRRAGGAEAAAGLDWQPWARLPVHILAERREALGGEGRSAFGLTLYGGLSRDLPHGFRIDAYGQAGLVGLRARDAFAEGSVRISAPVGPVEVGGGAWAAAQPGAERVDAGPSLSWRLPVRGAAIRLQADWRFRLAGEAAPGSGPALTLAADF